MYEIHVQVSGVVKSGRRFHGIDDAKLWVNKYRNAIQKSGRTCTHHVDQSRAVVIHPGRKGKIVAIQLELE